jgi:hypothetical protein
VPGTFVVFVVGVLVTAAASVYTIGIAQLNFGYGDSQSHLTIARRVLDSPAPGIQQLGTVWLPFPHLLLLLPVQSMFLWHTGIAGAIVGALCLGSASSSVYRILARLGVNGFGRVAALLVLWANPSLVYVTTTALTEPVLIATLLACIAGLVGWASSRRMLSGGELAVFAGFPAAAAVLTRYEGWALTASGTVFILFFCWRRRLPWRRWVACVASFVAAPVAALIAWVSYNYAMYGDALEFFHGQYSNAAFIQVWMNAGLVHTPGNLGLSLRVFSESIWEMSGLVPLLVAAFGLLAMTLRWGFNQRALVIWLAATSAAFLLYSLYAGQYLLMNAASLPPGNFNNRQNLSVLPWVSLLVGVAIGAWPRTRAARRITGLALAGFVVAMSLQNWWWSQDYRGRVAVVAEAIDGTQLATDRTKVSSWLHDHYDGGGLLLDETSIASSPQIGIPLKDYYNRDNGAAFSAALRNPARYVRWIFMHTTPEAGSGDGQSNDQVSAAMAKIPQLSAQYAVVYSAGDLEVLRRLDDALVYDDTGDAS